MKKVTIELDMEEDKLELQRMLKATDAYLVIWDMFNELRSVYKHGDDEVATEHAYKWRDKLSDICANYGIDVFSELE